MPKKSEFAQKLLDDLRLRKQRLATGQKRSDTPAQPQQRSRDRNTNKISGTDNRPHHERHKSFSNHVSSKEMVPIQQAQRSGYINDLHMALAFALENSGGLGKIQFTRRSHLGRQSIEIGLVGGRIVSDRHRSTMVQFPALSQPQIKEISKGAHKLNQILNSFSKGANFDGYSIDIGKELLKGARDLEESLKMLVNLQDASEYMVSSRKKNIQLLEDEDDDEAKVEVKDRMILHRPRSSFDGSSRKSFDTTKTSPFNQKLLALTADNHQLSSIAHTQAISGSAGHKRSSSSNLDSVVNAAFLGITNRDFNFRKLLGSEDPMKTTMPANVEKIKQKSSQGSEQENGRIPNVIAKLMGLDELPPKTDPKNNAAQKTNGSKQRDRKEDSLRQNAQNSMKEVVSMKTNLEKPLLQIDKQVKELQESKITATRDSTHKAVSRSELKTQENVHPLVRDSPKLNFEVISQMNMNRVNQVRETRIAKQDAEERAENTSPNEKKSTSKGEQMLSKTQKPVVEIHIQRKTLHSHENPEAAEDEESGTNKSLPQKKQKFAESRDPMPRKQRDSVQNNEYKLQPSMFRKSESHCAMQEADQNSNMKLQRGDERKSEVMLKNTMKQSHRMNSEKTKQTTTASKRSLTETVVKIRPKGHRSSGHLESIEKSVNGSMEEQRPFSPKRNMEMCASSAPIEIMNPLSTSSAQNKEDNKLEKTGKIEEARNKKVGSPSDMPQRLKQKSSVLHELKQRRLERISKNKEPTMSIQSQDLAQNSSHKVAGSSPSHDPIKEDCRRPKETHQDQVKAANITASISSMQNHDITSKESTRQLLDIPLYKDQPGKTYDSSAIQPKGLNECSLFTNSASLQQYHQDISRPERQDLLIEEENNLRQILINSEYFLNAAEALFNLQIPVGIRNASVHRCQDKNSKPVLDCAYEIMNRKGRREELAFHPSMKLPIVSVKVKCLDDLVKELHEDFNHLKSSGNAKEEYDAADNLHKILKREIQNKNPDINCMWDFGWNCTIFAYVEKNEVVRDLEKHLLNRLIDEITGDLLQVSTSRGSIRKL